uniref:SCP domain-containing protein n=1 Tax=Panagrolaimus sp. PS1159 TaxID=55785 RepID=A0AC35FFG4_9BILA
MKTLIAFLFFTLLKFIQATTYEIVIQKYQALDYHEVVGIEKSKYSFSFCICSKESKHPQNDSFCNCALAVSGKTAQNSCPQALYASSCLHSPNPRKCLYAKLESDAVSKFLYVKVEIHGRLLTTPEWQSLQPTKHKANAQLAANISNKRIKLSYIIFGSDDNKDVDVTTLRSKTTTSKETKTTKSFKPHRSSSLTTTRKPTEIKFSKTSIVTSNYHGDLDSIKSIIDAELALLRAGLSQRISPMSFDVNGFRKAMLDVHNRFRYMHGAELLTYDPKLEVAATSWANKLSSKASCLSHENRRGMGENLFYFAAEYFTDPVTMAEAVVRTFYAEGKNYDYTRYKRNYFQVGHFTQLIWKSTTKMGVGISIKKFNGRRTGPCQPNRPTSTMLYIVVKYSPEGNVQIPSVYLNNVKPVMRQRL